MPKVCYKPKNLSAASLEVVVHANRIIAEYTAQGYDLTLRQLYYQFVARDLIPNRQKEYDRLGRILSDARLAGLVDWSALVDRTRKLETQSHWDGPNDIVAACARQFRLDKWATQPYRVEVWIEKDALKGVLESVCPKLDVPYFSCRGYTSQSEMWAASQRLADHGRNGQKPYIIHLGDHDPSGIDMSRDIQDRLEMFQAYIRFNRIALNMDQVDEHSPPPNPAKLTDSRCEGYIAQFGSQSWELDALDPATLVGLIERTVLAVRDEDLWDEAVQEEQEAKDELATVARNWTEAVDGAEGVQE